MLKMKINKTEDVKETYANSFTVQVELVVNVQHFTERYMEAIKNTVVYVSQLSMNSKIKIQFYITQPTRVKTSRS